MQKILIIDDDEDILTLVENRLKQNDYEVVTARDGRRGIQKAVDTKPDLIIMDVMMPGMSGGEAVKLLKNIESTKSIPVLFFTAMVAGSANEDELDSINVNGQLYPALTKPFEPSRLIAAVQMMVR